MNRWDVSLVAITKGQSILFLDFPYLPGNTKITSKL